MRFIASVVVVILGATFFFYRPWVGTPKQADTNSASSHPVDSFFMPAEFHDQETLMLGGTQLAELHPDVLAGIVKAASDAVKIQVLVGSTETRSLVETVLSDNHLPDSSVGIMELPILTMWVRDFGPVTVSDAEGRRSMVDFHYRERRGNKNDDGIPSFISLSMGLNLMGSPLLVEGGDFLSNGRGLCLLSTRVVNRNAHYLEMEPDQTMANFASVLGFEQLYLAPPLVGELTGHVDMFCAILKTDLVLVSRFEPSVDPENETQLDRIAAEMAVLQTREGPLRVERIPMPDHDDGFWRTYTNIVFANDVLLVPVYPDYCPDLDKVALATYRRLLPDMRVVGIDCSRLIKMNGALRCITMNVPSDKPLFPADVSPGN
ncbi:MAG: agmatine deiminase family protein [Candidatus Krumholzibacteria bacterium]|nr:agmatine deiminase family protein [Candidatus Krumholzibacteria bacterium]